MSTHILVLARRDAYEAIRVAAGLTIRNNTVDFVFMTKPSINAQGKFDHFEMLELAEIAPQSLIDGVPDTVPCTDLAGVDQQSPTGGEFLMEKLTLKTGLFADADVIIQAADAPVIDLTADLSDDDWDNVLDQILECDLVITA